MPVGPVDVVTWTTHETQLLMPSTEDAEQDISLTYWHTRQINENIFTFQHSHRLRQCTVYNYL